MLALICSLNPSLSYCGKKKNVVPFASKVQNKKRKISKSFVRYKKEINFYINIGINTFIFRH